MRIRNRMNKPWLMLSVRRQEKPFFHDFVGTTHPWAGHSHCAEPDSSCDPLVPICPSQGIFKPNAKASAPD